MVSVCSSGRYILTKYTSKKGIQAPVYKANVFLVQTHASCQCHLAESATRRRSRSNTAFEKQMALPFPFISRSEQQ